VALKHHVDRYPPVEVEIWDRTDPDKRKHHRRTARLIFTTAAGRPIQRSSWGDLWAPAARSAGIPKGNGVHMLRHYFATRLIHNGASVKRVQLALGTHRLRSRLTPTLGSGPTPTAKPARSSMPLLAVCPACALCPCLAGRCAAR
jgi:integrase